MQNQPTGEYQPVESSSHIHSNVHIKLKVAVLIEYTYVGKVLTQILMKK